jgi:hypothetical protein
MNFIKLKTQPVEGFQMAAPSGEALVFIANGPRWNGLQEYICVSPERLARQKLIANEAGGSLGQVIQKTFGNQAEKHVVLASPELIPVLSEVAL